MYFKRKVTKSYKAPTEPGFLGSGHMARAVIQIPYSQSDPFIVLMDDMLDKKDNIPAGGPHPHAGFETVSLMVDGEIIDSMDRIKAGDFQIMTAGSGIIHTGTITQPTKGRLLQMWLNLPSKYRSVEPRAQDLPANRVPVYNANGVTIRLYSGSLAGLRSPIINYVPLLVAEFNIEPGASTIQTLPADFNAFVYVLKGNVYVGDDKKLLEQDETGWLDFRPGEGDSELTFTTGIEGTRLILYAAKPQGEPFVSQGPFIADTDEDIKKVYSRYIQGKLQHIADKQ
jgi:redox-sensitive bicupin YhaK (pirin superfamily)